MAYDRGKLEQLALELQNDEELHKKFCHGSENAGADVYYREEVRLALNRMTLRDDVRRKSTLDERKVLHRHLFFQWNLTGNLSVLEPGDVDLYPNSAYDNCTSSTCPEHKQLEPVTGRMSGRMSGGECNLQNLPKEVRSSSIPWARIRALQHAAIELEDYYRWSWASMGSHIRFERLRADMQGGHKFKGAGFTGGTDMEVLLVVRHLDGTYLRNQPLTERPDFHQQMRVDVDLFPLSTYTGSGAKIDWHSGCWWGCGGEILPDANDHSYVSVELSAEALEKYVWGVGLTPLQEQYLNRLDRDPDGSILLTKKLQDSIAGHMQKAASAIARVDAALVQTRGQSQTSPELGTTQESNMTKSITITVITTASTDAKENSVRTLVNGVDIKTLSMSQIYALISDSETLIETLSKIKNKPLHLQAEIDAHKAGIDALVEHLNQRYLQENPDTVVAKPAAKRRAPIKVEPKAQEGASPAA